MKNETINTENVVATTENVVATKQLGRPVNPNSARQLKLAAKSTESGAKRGRPVNGESARQKRLNELEAKRVNGELKLGRPVNGESARQKRLAELEAKRANGEVKRGRPAKVKVETPVVETTVAELVQLRHVSRQSIRTTLLYIVYSINLKNIT